MKRSKCRVKIYSRPVLRARLCSAHFQRLCKTGSTNPHTPIASRDGTATTVGSRERRTWDSMIQRCSNPRNKSYDRYGGRGIKVCRRWLKFKNFLADMGIRPEGHTLGRKNNNGGYSLANCRWETAKEQAKNMARSPKPLEVYRFKILRKAGLSYRDISKLTGRSGSFIWGQVNVWLQIP